MSTKAEARTYALLRQYKASRGLEDLEKYQAHAWGIGYKVVQGKRTTQLALRVYVDRKRPLAALSATTAVPPAIEALDARTGARLRIPTDVVEVPPMRFQVDPESRLRPVPGGAGFGTPSAGGTLGGWVWDRVEDDIVMLSNEHVLGHTVGTGVLQPSVNDGGVLADDRIGQVRRGIARSPTTVNQVDCAIAAPDASDIAQLEVLEIGPAVYVVDNAVMDLLVEKFGQTTDHTFGQITDLDCSGSVSGIPFEDCMFVEPVSPSTQWSSSGDSGSLVMSQTVANGTDLKPAVGLHFAGEGTNGVACKIGNVFAALDLTSLCSGAFEAFLDALFDAEEEAEENVTKEAEAGLRRVAALARGGRVAAEALLTARERRRPARRGAGMARRVQAALLEGAGGKKLVAFADQNRHALLTLLVRDVDVRRATIAALRPLVKGAVVSDDVLRRPLAAKDVERLEALAELVASRTSDKQLASRLKVVRALGAAAAGRSLGQALGVK